MERSTDPKAELIRGVDPRFLAARGIVTARAADGGVVVGMADPDDAETVAALAFALRKPVTAVADHAPPVADVRPSLSGRVMRGLRGTGVARWVAVDAVAQLVARGASVSDAVARVRRDAPDAAAMLDAIGAGRAPEDWATPLMGPGREAILLTLVAGRMRFEIARGIAIRRAGMAPGMVLVAGLALVGWWGLLPAIMLPAARGALRPLAVARRTGRAVTARMLTGEGVVPVDGLTAAECDRLADEPEAVMRAVDDRALLAVEGAGAALGMPMLAILALLAMVRLG